MATSVRGMATRMLGLVRGGPSGNPKPQESAEVEMSASEWVGSLLTSAGLPTTVEAVESRSGLGVDLSRRMLALALARSQMRHSG